MKQRIVPFKLLLIICFFGQVACKPAKTSGAKTVSSKHAEAAVNMCGLTIRYHAEKLKDVKSGQEMTVPTDITFNPSEKLITLSAQPPNEPKESFDTVIESFDCDFNISLTTGQAVYKGYIKNPDGATTSTTIVIEAGADGIVIRATEPGKDTGLLLTITQWEIVK